MYAKQQRDKPEAFWKQLLWTDEVSQLQSGVFGEKKKNIIF